MQAFATIALLIVSNIFMTFAWYGHLRFRSVPLWEAILVSWLIAFMEYCFQVPANRIGSYQFSATQLKIIQEIITLVVFSVFSILYLKQQFRWNYLVAFAFILGAVYCVFSNDNGAAARDDGSRLDASSSTKSPVQFAPTNLRKIDRGISSDSVVIKKR